MAFNLENLKIENNHNEIVSTLIRMYRESSPVLIWQNQGNERLMKNSYIKEIYPEKSRFVLAPLPDNTNFNFNDMTTLYLRGNERSILFKQSDIKILKDKIFVRFPKEVRLYENRFHSRFHYGFKSNHTVEVFHPRSTVDTEEIFKFSLYDISEQGASFNVKLSDQRFFFQGDRLNIVKIGHKSFKQFFTGKIVYMVRVDNKINGVHCPSMKMGVHFERALSRKELPPSKDLKSAFYNTHCLIFAPSAILFRFLELT